jgi:hypothetical protein
MAKKMKVASSLSLYVDLEISETLLVWANEKVRLSG